MYIKNNFSYLVGNNEEDSVIFKYEIEKKRKINNGDKIGKLII